MKEEINTLLEALTASKEGKVTNALEKVLNVVLSDSSAALLAISGLDDSPTKDALLCLFRPVAGLGMAISAVKNHLIQYGGLTTANPPDQESTKTESTSESQDSTEQTSV